MGLAPGTGSVSKEERPFFPELVDKHHQTFRRLTIVLESARGVPVHHHQGHTTPKSRSPCHWWHPISRSGSPNIWVDRACWRRWGPACS